MDRAPTSFSTLFIYPFERDQHWVVRILAGLGCLAFVAYVLGLPASMGAAFGEGLRHVQSPAAQQRLLAVACGVVWLGGFLVLSVGYALVLFKDRALPQLWTMPLSDRQVYVRQLRAVATPALLSLAPTAALHIAFVVGYAGWDPHLLAGALLLTALQGMLNLLVPVAISLFALPVYFRLSLALLMATGAFFMWLLHYTSSPAEALTRFDAYLNAAGVGELLSAFPGTWTGHLFYTAFVAQEHWLPWAVAITLGSLALAALVAFLGQAAYTKDRVLAQFEGAVVLSGGRRTTPPDQSDMPVLPLGASLVDRLYERLLNRRERAIASLLFRRDFTGGIARRLRNVSLLAATTWGVVLMAPHVSLLLGMPPALGSGIVAIFAFYVYLGAWGLWLGDPRARTASGSSARGSRQEPLIEVVPVSPKEYHWVYVRACAFAIVLTGLLFLPAVMSLPVPPSFHLALALGSFVAPLGAAVVLPVLRSLACMRHPHRSPGGAFRVCAYWAVGLAAPQAGLGGLIVAVDPVGRRGDLVLPVVLLAAFAVVCTVVLYALWRILVARHNYDVECEMGR